MLALTIFVVCLLFVGLISLAVITRVFDSASPDGSRQDKKKSIELILTLANRSELRLIPITGNQSPFVTEGPITNAQFCAAVKQNQIAPPTLPHELRFSDCETVAWKDMDFQKGQGENAVLFVTVQEARAYCAWLQNQFPKYHFRIPRALEAREIEIHESSQGFNGRKPDSFPRPVSGPDAKRTKGRFWIAPFTYELYGDDEPMGPDVEPPQLDRNAPATYFRIGPAFDGTKYIAAANPSLSGPSVIPTTFRVVAVKIEQH